MSLLLEEMTAEDYKEMEMMIEDSSIFLESYMQLPPPPPPPEYTEVDKDSYQRRMLFENFVESCGIQLSMHRAFVALYDEKKKPNNPLPYLAYLMGYGVPDEEEFDKLQEEISLLREERFYYEKKIRRMTKRLVEDAIREEREQSRLSYNSKILKEIFGEWDNDFMLGIGVFYDTYSSEEEDEEEEEDEDSEEEQEPPTIIRFDILRKAPKKPLRFFNPFFPNASQY